MTYCPSAIPEPRRLEVWVELAAPHLEGRAIFTASAFFRKYRCRSGTSTNTSQLGEDVGVLMCLPTADVPGLVWFGGKIDIADTIHKLLLDSGPGGTLLTLAAYTFEFEVDVAERSYAILQERSPETSPEIEH